MEWGSCTAYLLFRGTYDIHNAIGLLCLFPCFLFLRRVETAKASSKIVNGLKTAAKGGSDKLLKQNHLRRCHYESKNVKVFTSLVLFVVPVFTVTAKKVGPLASFGIQNFGNGKPAHIRGPQQFHYGLSFKGGSH